MDWSMVTGVASAVIALCALVISLWHGYRNRVHNKLSCRPHLTAWTQEEPEKGTFDFELMNNGLGPATIEKFEISVDKQVVEGRGPNLFGKVLEKIFEGHDYKAQHGFLGNSYVMAANERRKLLSLQFAKKPFPSGEAIRKALNRVDLKIDYSSFYNEKFYFSTEDGKEEILGKDNEETHLEKAKT